MFQIQNTMVSTLNEGLIFENVELLLVNQPKIVEAVYP